MSEGFGLQPWGTSAWGDPLPNLPSATSGAVRPVSPVLLYGDLRTGRIIDVLDATSCSWSQVSNDAGRVDSVTVPEAEVRGKRLRVTAAAARTFLAVEVGGRIQEAGPIWSRTWDDAAGQLTLGAAGLWSLFDHRKVLPVLDPGTRVQDAVVGSAGTDLGGIGILLVREALMHVGGDLPLILPTVLSGTRRETFYGWQLLDLGDQLRQLTKRQSGAPDIRFLPRWTADRLGVEWVMQVGTENAPLLTQAGEDWYFDASAPLTPVINISTDEDATVMGQRAWVTGSGNERDVLIGTDYDPGLVDAGWPLLEVEELRSSVIEQATLDGYAAALVDRSSRPVEKWTVIVHASAAAEVLAGDYCRVIPRRDHPWLDGGEAFMRVKTKSGDLGDRVTLEMYPVAGRI